MEDIEGRVRNPYQIRIGQSMFDFSNIDSETVDLMEIVNPLSKNQRFNGHTDIDFTVLQHSYFVGQMIFNETADPIATLAGLIHDFHEAFITDIPTPLKNIIRDKFNFDFKSVSDDLDRMILRSLDLNFLEDALKGDIVRKYDAMSLTYELAEHFKPGFIRPDYDKKHSYMLELIRNMTRAEVIDGFLSMYGRVKRIAIERYSEN